MAEFTGELQCFKSPLPLWEMDSNMELLNQFAELNPSLLQNSNLSMQSLMSIYSDNFLSNQQPELPVNFADNLLGILHTDRPKAEQVVQSVASVGDVYTESRKRKAMAVSESSSRNSSPPVSEVFSGDANKIKRKNNLGRGKKGKRSEKEAEKPKEVIHVRARRGQATDSHSLAERVRREKINERLRCLQNLVPGCYKTMGMAVMLDEIINYVQSLQNQVEFLSMKLTAASSFYDFNSEPDQAPETMQGTDSYVAEEMERLIREGHGGLSCFNTTWPL